MMLSNDRKPIILLLLVLLALCAAGCASNDSLQNNATNMYLEYQANKQHPNIDTDEDNIVGGTEINIHEPVDDLNHYEDAEKNHAEGNVVQNPESVMTEDKIIQMDDPVNIHENYIADFQKGAEEMVSDDINNDEQKTMADLNSAGMINASMPESSEDETNEKIDLISFVGGNDTIDSYIVYRATSGTTAPDKTTVTQQDKVQSVIDVLSQNARKITEFSGISGYTIALRLYSGDRLICRIQPVDEKLFVSYEKKHYIFEYASNISAVLQDALK